MFSGLDCGFACRFFGKECFEMFGSESGLGQCDLHAVPDKFFVVGYPSPNFWRRFLKMSVNGALEKG
jgi:hypothetical protein